MSGTDRFMELQKTLTEINQKYTYFLMAAVGAAVGFSITQTSKAPLSWWFLPLAFALFLWGTSFVFGCVTLQLVVRMFNLSIAGLDMSAGRNPICKHDPAAIEIGVATLKKEFDKENARATLFQRWQFYLFILGVAFFIMWHIIEMWRRIPENMCLWV
ncbi:hypothetical protein HC956_05115 [Alcaligenes faecalis]|uniref:Uncharacterized protein n=1 Tax=Alcaligenes ammonioxydans TaxID=2582914 RepID=A0ABX8SQZ3_9BURK|nr:hypothetical protein [Alcaligenes ammonioxydans]QXX78457.1 hypothetical protein FE795_05115 [Alcaligenes ammonioxydans]